MNNNIGRGCAAIALSSFAAGFAFAGVPLNNLQGTGGIAFNPLAYTAGQPWEGGETNSLNEIVSKPQLGAWYVNLNDAGVNWWAGSAALTFAQRLEVSAGYGYINAHKYGDKSIDTYNLGAKAKFLDENAFDTKWVPALAVGGVYKYTNSRTVDALGLDKDGFDAYVVASKLVPEAPVPVLLSAGLLLSDEVVNGEKLGDRPRDCASNLHNICLPSKNNATFQNGHFGGKALVFGSRGVRLGLRVCATT